MGMASESNHAAPIRCKKSTITQEGAQVGTKIDIDEDRWPRLLLSLSEDRCGLCKCPKVVANATPGMQGLARGEVEGEFWDIGTPEDWERAERHFSA